MSHQTYWLSQRDAEPVIIAIERFDNVTQAQAERASGHDQHNTVVEITVTRHGRRAAPSRTLKSRYPTLLEALLADERASRDDHPKTNETPESVD